MPSPYGFGQTTDLSGFNNIAIPLNFQNNAMGVTANNMAHRGLNAAAGMGNTGTGTASWFGQDGIVGGISQGLNALSGLAGAYLGYKNYKLAKEQFGFEKALANRNIANQGKIVNNQYNNAAQVAAGMAGGGYGMVDPAIVAQYAAKAKEQHVNTSPIG